MEKQVLKINPLDVRNWNELILTHPGYSFFHTKEWAQVLFNTYNYKPVYFCVLNKDRLLSTIPTMLINSVLTGKRLVSLPFTDRCNPLLNSTEDAEELKNEIFEYCQNNKINLIEFRASIKLFPHESANPTDLYYLLILNQPEENLFKSFSENTRRNIRKAIKAGVHVRRENSEDSLRSYYKMQCATRKKHGIPPQPFLFFSNLFTNIILKNKGDIWLADWNDRIIAGAIFLRIGKRAVFKYGASDSVLRHGGASHLIMWEAIKAYNKQCFEELDLGRTELKNEGLRRYKRSFNSKEGAIYREIFDLKNKKLIPANIKVTGVHNKAFSRMPLSLLKIIGKIMYRHIG